MSHRIEHYKRVITFPPPKGDDRFPSYMGEIALFISSGSDNNVSPRDYDWEIEEITGISVWGGEIQLPMSCWSGGHAADGGMIKPWGKDVSGLNYVRAWKKAAAERFSCVSPDGKLLWFPRISIWHFRSGIDGTTREAKEVNDLGVEAFSPRYKHLRQPLYDAFKQLFPNTLQRSNTQSSVSNLAEFHDAVYLRWHREHLPVSFHLTHRADCAFLQNGPNRQLSLERVA